MGDGVDARGATVKPDGDGIEYLLWRHVLDDGRVTTLYAVRHPRRSTRVRVVHFPDTERLDVWCAANEVDEAIIGGFFLRDPYRPLGDLWIDGRSIAHEPIVDPYAARRACVVDRRRRCPSRCAVGGPRRAARRPRARRAAARPRRVGRLRRCGRRGLLRRRRAVRLGHHGRPAPARRPRRLGPASAGGRMRRATLARRRRSLDARAGRCDGRARRRHGRQPRRRRLHDARPPQASPQPAVLDTGSARTRSRDRS